jgi:hypothetical protein
MRLKSRNTVVPLNEYDVFLSFNDADEDVDRWVNSILVPELTNAGYSVFKPNRDATFGAERDSEIIDILSKTRNFLTIMSESYLQESEEGMRSWTENEWKYGWNNFKNDRSKNIVLVNFDHLSSFDVNKPQLKAFLRVGCTVDFKNHDRKIMQEIFEKLGLPYKSPTTVDKIGNRELTSNLYEIFTAASTNDKPFHNTAEFKITRNDLTNKLSYINYKQGRQKETCKYRKSSWQHKS